MKKSLQFVVISLFSIILYSCSEAPKTNMLGNPELQQVYDVADARNAQELNRLLRNENALVREIATKLAGSVQDSLLLPNLYINLQDSSSQIRAAAAFAIGQCGSSEDVAYLISWGRNELDSDAQREICIAIAKLFDPNRNTKSVEKEVAGFIFNVQENDFVDFLMNMSINDEASQTGLGYAVYYLHRKGMFHDPLMSRIRFALQTSGAESRPVLALAMSTYEGGWLESNADYINQWVKTERNGDAKVYIIKAMAKMYDPESRDYLYTMAASSQYDHRLNMTAMQSLIRRNEKDESRWKKILANADPQVVSEAINYYQSDFKASNVEDMTSVITSSLPLVDAAKSRVLLATKKMTTASVIEKINAASDSYNKAFYIEALRVAPNAETFLSELLLSSKDPVITTACINTILSLQEHVSLSATKTTLLKALALDDTGVVSAIAMHVQRSTDFEGTDEWENAIQTAKAKLVLPRDIEAFNELVRMENAMFNRDIELAKATSTSRIDWEYVSLLPAFVTVEFETDKGFFTCELNTLDAPGSVNTICKLVDDGFYNGKRIHRVVPLFVTQGGCPIGNGMGGLDQPIRSEFNMLRFERGSIGLASAGKDTESCQFFVTQVITPSLDGRYTNFGKVTSGLDVVDQLIVGSKIISAKRIEKKN
ncbi:MAG: peptidylprolyl isomerase [Flavobacteriales bacterium]